MARAFSKTLFNVLMISGLCFFVFFLHSCEQSYHRRRSSSLQLCSMNTGMVPLFTSSASTCGSSMGTAGNSSYLVQTPYLTVTKFYQTTI